ncbi:hypothetical protein HII31_05134 [Pseudocercospora fuligena]|uniref:BTB domain-containing protein n=1 Tax=Pseudocercospora fuligena TaxID=685502 RepID=A0A8H6VMH8_9PEZI|nr:hypothetical protein HII31_05134 [Pseudocercospora fuligena]
MASNATQVKDTPHLSNRSGGPATKTEFDLDDVINDQWFHRQAPVIPLADLTTPVTVTVHLQEGGAKKTFRVNRGCICARSDYFEKAFRSGFQESSSREITLQDDGIATSRVFEIFIAYIHTGRIYENDGAFAEHGTLPAESSEPGMQASPACEPPSKRVKLSSPADREDTNVDRLVAHRGLMLSCAPPAGSTVNPPAHPAQPITWRWKLLFAIYVFADKYDSVGLRNLVMNFVQMKLTIMTPLIFDMPTLGDSRFPMENLPSSSPLRRLLAEFWGVQCDLQFIGDHNGGKEASTVLEELPSSFLADCLVAGKKYDEACGRDPDSSDAMRPLEKSQCAYHEHQNDGQIAQAQCREGWVFFRETFGHIPEVEREENGEEVDEEESD